MLNSEHVLSERGTAKQEECVLLSVLESLQHTGATLAVDTTATTDPVISIKEETLI